MPAAPEEFRHLAGLTSLSYCMMLEGSRITDTELAQLSGLTRLGNLIVRNTAITDASLSTILGFPKLSRLDVRGTRLTAAACRELLSANANTFTDYA